MKKTAIMTASMAMLLITPASADIAVRFDEGAPKDRFTITNTGNCALPVTNVTIDLRGSAGKLIFDVTASGAGVEVFQPFQLVSGRQFVSALPRVRDGDKAVSLKLKGLGAGKSVAFTIDVDDTIGAREITVNGSEIKGARVRAGKASGRFGSNARAIVNMSKCTS